MTAPVVAALLSQSEAALRPLADTLQAVPMRAHMVDQFALLGIRAYRSCAASPAESLV